MFLLFFSKAPTVDSYGKVTTGWVASIEGARSGLVGVCFLRNLSSREHSGLVSQQPQL